MHAVLLTLTTIFRRLALPVVVFLVWTPAAHAWSWRVQGPVLQPFSYDEAQPYAAGQHRGIDIGADALGEVVRAPADGTVTFAGTVPTNGKVVTIETADGYAVTLTHLGSIAVSKDAALAEGDPVGTIGPSGTAEMDVPYVHLGIRIATDPNGYLDPLDLLPPIPEAAGSESVPATPQPSANGGSSSSAAPVSAPAPVPPATSAPVATPQGTAVPASRAHAPSHQRGRSQASHANARPQRHSNRLPVSQPEPIAPRVARRPHVSHRHVSAPVSASQRPVVEVAAPRERADLDAGHELRPTVQVARTERHPSTASSAPFGLVVNGAAALVAIAAAFAAGRRRRRDLAGQVPVAQVMPLPRPALERHVRRAA